MDPYATLADRIAPGATLVRRQPLAGGVSAQVEVLELALPDGRAKKLVLRRHGAAAWKPLAAGVTVTEFDLLGALAAAGMEVPAPVHLEATGELLGSPCFVMELVEGTSEIAEAALPDALEQMARYLVRLHALPPRVATLPAGEDPVAGALAYLPPDDPVRPALAPLVGRPAKNGPAIVHGDFWPANILWKDGRIAAVIDWEDAALGDPLSDIAGCRLELLWKYGSDAADAFTRSYLSAAPIDGSDLPVWELYAASAALAYMGQWSLAPQHEAELRRKAASVIAKARRAIGNRT